MGRMDDGDGRMDRLLAKALQSDARPDGRTATELRRKMAAGRGGARRPALWWLPALAGTACTACLLWALSFVGDWRCVTAALAAGSVFTLSAWALSIVCFFQFNLLRKGGWVL